MTNANDPIRFEAALSAGDIVEARWTNCHSYYAARARIVRINKRTIRVELLEELKDYRGEVAYTVGRQIVCQSFFGNWSQNNRVAPLAPQHAEEPAEDAHSAFLAAIGC